MSEPPAAEIPAVTADPVRVSINSPATHGAGTWLLDAGVVFGSMWIVHDTLFALFALMKAPKPSDMTPLATIAGTLATVLTLATAYAAFRWGSSDAMKKTAAGDK